MRKVAALMLDFSASLDPDSQDHWVLWVLPAELAELDGLVLVRQPSGS
jgi:hypothetical protein